MSRKLPAVTGEELIRALERSGFVVARVRGTHHRLQHPDGRGRRSRSTPGRPSGVGFWGRFFGIASWIGSDFRSCCERRRTTTTPNQLLHLTRPAKPGRVAVNFTADRAHLDKLTLEVWVQTSYLGGTIYELPMQKPVEPAKGP